MKLRIKKRNADRKSETKNIRNLKQIPAVVYAAGMPNENIIVDEAEFQAILRTLKEGHLSTAIFELKSDERTVKAIVKDIQYHRTSYRIEHLDFLVLDDKKVINLNVPIVCFGMVDCVGMKLGGALRQIIRKLKVTCLPRDIPSAFNVDVSKMQLNESKRLSDIAIPENVRPRARMDEIAVAIVKR